jgi:hypothetical protein
MCGGATDATAARRKTFLLDCDDPADRIVDPPLAEFLTNRTR